MTKLHSHLKKGFISILSLTLIFSNISVYALDLDNSNIIVEEENLNEDTILIQDEENNIEDNSIIEENNEQSNFNQNDIVNNSNILDDYNINQEDVSSLMSNDNNDENNIATTSLDKENIAIQSNDATTIDVTSLASGSETSHDCNKYLTTKYDSNQHWKECSICGKIIGNKSNHNITISWATNAPHCNSANLGTKYCTEQCGYSVQFREEDKLGTKYEYTDQGWNHHTNCTVCGQWCGGGDCIKNDGTRITCNNLGTCKICGHTYTQKNHFFNYGSTTCYMCGYKLFDSARLKSITYSADRRTAYITYNIKPNTNITPTNVFSWSGSGGFTVTSTTYTQLADGSYDLKYTCSVTTYPYQITMYLQPRMYFTYNGVTCLFHGDLCSFFPDGTAPTINVTQKDISSINGWTTSKQLTISGTETYSDGVYIQMTDTNGKEIYPYSYTTVTNGKYSFSFAPSIEAASATDFKINVKDKSGNIGTKTITIQKVDSKAPTPTSGTTTSTTWSTSKNMTFTATDAGSGNVQIAFNNTNNYLSTTKNNTSYSKTYTFIGDVYGSTKAAVYYKDVLSNETTQFITISNIDNTKPTITKVESSKAIGSTSLTVTANDFNATLNKSGSGVSKYIITSTNTTPSENDSNWQDSNVLKVTTPGTYYIFSKDLVGNISNAYEIKDVKVDYTLSVNPNGGSWNNSSSTQEFTITNGNTKPIANPSKVGYTFKNWTLSGANAKFENNLFTMGNANASLVANWNVNQYDVTYIDVVGSTSGTQLGKTTKKVNYNSSVRGSDLGSNTSDNAYYNGYYYSSDTSAIVTTNGATVYRIFKLRTIDKTSNLTWNDNNNKNGFRPSKYMLKLLRNGALFKQVELTSSQTSYTFSNLTKYDSNGKTFKYTFQVDASDRYKISLDANGNTITENYQNSTFSVTIPKTISLNGLTGKGSYNVKVNGALYYNDTLTVTPSSSFTLKDRNNINSLQANVIQNVTTFTKDNLGTTSGSINLNKIKFAGKYNGTFNFNIKFTLKN